MSEETSPASSFELKISFDNDVNLDSSVGISPVSSFFLRDKNSGSRMEGQQDL